MQSISADELKLLAQFRSSAAPCVSIYAPTHRHFPETDQNPIRFKNLMRTAEQRLTEAGVAAAKISELTAPLRELLGDRDFWKHQGDGLAVFAAQDLFVRYRIPLVVPEVAVVAQRFHLKPLLTLLSKDRRFYILALSQKHARLFEGSLDGATEITPGEFPDGIQAILEQYDSAKQLQFHTGTAGGSTSQSALFHGQGGAEEDLKNRIVEYFREVDRSLIRSIGRSGAPLVLAAVDYLLPIYRGVNTYPNLLGTGVTGNPDSLTAEQLHQKAWGIAEPVFQASRKDAIEKYNALSGAARSPGSRASNDLREVLVAAHAGRVDTLFVAVGVQNWGQFDVQSGALTSNGDNPLAEDLLDLAAVQTLLNGGSVFAVNAGEMPDGRPIAAVFRY